MTSGIYAYFRHPSYFGWSVWAIGTQFILANPISIVAYAFAAHKFFKDRVPFEEAKLLEFFGLDYYEYAKRVPHRLPFIKTRLDKSISEEDD